MPKIIICKECGKKKGHHAHNLCITCYERLRYNNSKEEFHIKRAEYRIKNRDKLREQHRTYIKNHKEQKKISDRKYYLKNKDRSKENGKRWRKEHPEIHKLNVRNRRIKYKELGICINCLSDIGISESNNYCQKCYEYHKLKQKEHRKKYSIIGRCQGCGEMIDTMYISSTYCMSCRETKLKRTNDRREKRKIDKLCADCGSHLDCESLYYCYRCLIKRRQTSIRQKQGLNPYNLSENVKIYNKKLGAVIIGET